MAVEARCAVCTLELIYSTSLNAESIFTYTFKIADSGQLYGKDN